MAGDSNSSGESSDDLPAKKKAVPKAASQRVPVKRLMPQADSSSDESSDHPPAKKRAAATSLPQCVPVKRLVPKAAKSSDESSQDDAPPAKKTMKEAPQRVPPVARPEHKASADYSSEDEAPSTFAALQAAKKLQQTSSASGEKKQLQAAVSPQPPALLAAAATASDGSENPAKKQAVSSAHAEKRPMTIAEKLKQEAKKLKENAAEDTQAGKEALRRAAQGGKAVPPQAPAATTTAPARKEDVATESVPEPARRKKSVAEPARCTVPPQAPAATTTAPAPKEDVATESVPEPARRKKSVAEPARCNIQILRRDIANLKKIDGAEALVQDKMRQLVELKKIDGAEARRDALQRDIASLEKIDGAEALVQIKRRQLDELKDHGSEEEASSSSSSSHGGARMRNDEEEEEGAQHQRRNSSTAAIDALRSREKKPPTHDSLGAKRLSDEGLTVFVGGLAYDCRTGMLKEEFEECGEIIRVYMPKSKANEALSKGIAWITFASEESVLAALKFNGKPYNDRILKVNLASEKPPAKPAGKQADEKDSQRPRGGGDKRKKEEQEEDGAAKASNKAPRGASFDMKLTVVAKGLPYDLAEKQIKKDFSTDCGEIASLRMPVNDGGTHRGVAFITFQTKEAVEIALGFSGSPYSGRTITVERAKQVDKGKDQPDMKRNIGGSEKAAGEKDAKGHQRSDEGVARQKARKLQKKHARKAEMRKAAKVDG